MLGVPLESMLWKTVWTITQRAFKCEKTSTIREIMNDMIIKGNLIPSVETYLDYLSLL